MAQQGIHDAAPKVAPVSDIYTERPYGEAITAEHREALANSAPVTRGPSPRSTPGPKARAKTPRGRAKAKEQTPVGGSTEAAAAVAAEEQPTA